MYMVFLICSCSRQVIRQPVSEIDRPLFLPQKNWQVSFGGGAENMNYFEKYVRDDEWTANQILFHFEKNIWFPVVDIKWPSLYIGNTVEFNVPATFRWYIVKNVEKVHGIERISGANVAAINEITGIYYNFYRGLTFYTRHAVTIKTVLSKRLWFSSCPAIYLLLPVHEPLQSQFEANLRMPFSIGCQITERWSCKGTATFLGFYNYYGPELIRKRDQDNIVPEQIDYYARESENRNWDYAIKQYNLDLKFPLQTSFVFSSQWEGTFLIQGNIYDKNNISITSALWFTVTW